jgi:V8-like Glu-specific endopeptidase
MRILLILILVGLIGCEDKVDSCSDDIILAKKSLEEGFKDINTENPKLNEFKVKLESYLSAFEDKKCMNDGEEFHPHKEIKSLVSEIKNNLKQIQTKVVYGDDDRVDVVDHPNSDFRNYANSVAALISESQISLEGILSGETLGQKYNLCSGENFYDQKVIASCTGFLVDDDLLVTAGHCVGSAGKCDPGSKWVFGYSGTSYKVNPDDIYKCGEVVSSEWNDSTQLDYALVRLDRKVVGRKPLNFRLSGRVDDSSPLVVLGHPTGLPLKIADNANVRQNNSSNYFVANLDTFGGNSGSPVINVDTGVVEGILVRGEEDYDSIPDPRGVGFCRVTYKCENNECDGEESTRVTLVKGLDHYKLNGVELDYKKIFLEAGKVQSHFPLSVSTKKGFSYNLSGKKFLNTCISQIYDRHTNQWQVASSFDCSSKNFESAYQNYIDLGERR